MDTVTRGEKVALVLSGGGGRGAFECGAIEKLTELAGSSSPGGKPKWPPDILVGTSIGATNAAVWAVGGTDGLSDMWDRIRPRDMHRFMRRPPWRSILDRQAWKRTLERYAPESALAEVTQKLYIVATDINTGRPIIFTNDREDADLDDVNRRRLYLRYQRVEAIKHEHLLASSAIPHVYPRVEVPVEVLVGEEDITRDIQTHEFWDGAVTYNSPLEPAILAGAAMVWAVLLSPFHTHITAVLPEPPGGLSAKLSHLLDLGITATFENDLYQMVKRDQPLEVIAPQGWFGLFDHVRYGRGRIEELREQGRKRAKDVWDELAKAQLSGSERLVRQAMAAI